MGPFKLLDHLQADAVDLPSFMLAHIIRSDREKIEEKIDRLKSKRMKVRDVLETDKMRAVYHELSDYIDGMMTKIRKAGK